MIAGLHMEPYVEACKILPCCLLNWLYHFELAPALNVNSSCSSAFVVTTVLDFSLSKRCIVISHCHFNFQFPNET